MCVISDDEFEQSEPKFKSFEPDANLTPNDLEISRLKARNARLESALYSALRLRGLGEAYHDNMAYQGERKKYKAQMDEIEKEIRDALKEFTECNGK